MHSALSNVVTKRLGPHV